MWGFMSSIAITWNEENANQWVLKVNTSVIAIVFKNLIRQKSGISKEKYQHQDYTFDTLGQAKSSIEEIYKTQIKRKIEFYENYHFEV
jgi:hypothetical protein